MPNPNPPKVPKDSKSPKNSRPGYEYLSAYMLGKVIQELTNEFCQKFLKDPKDPNCPNFKLIEQVNGAARSNPQNIAEGYTHESLKGYIYLTGIANGSNEELAKDYEDYLIHRKLEVWSKNDPKLPSNSTKAANMLLTFCNMEGYLLSKLAESLREKHRTEGGMTENLYRKRVEYRETERTDLSGKVRP